MSESNLQNDMKEFYMRKVEERFFEEVDKGNHLLAQNADLRVKISNLEKNIEKYRSDVKSLKERVQELQLKESNFMIIGDVLTPNKQIAKEMDDITPIEDRETEHLKLIDQLRKSLRQLMYDKEALVIKNSRFREQITRLHKRMGKVEETVSRSENIAQFRKREGGLTDDEFLKKCEDEEVKRLSCHKQILQSAIRKHKEELALNKKGAEETDLAFKTLEEENIKLKCLVEQLKQKLAKAQESQKEREVFARLASQSIKSRQASSSQTQSSQRRHIRDYITQLFSSWQKKIAIDPRTYDYDKLEARLVGIITQIKTEFTKK